MDFTLDNNINFDLSVNLEQPINPSQESSLNSQELDKIVEESVPTTTAKSTKWGVNVFEKWMNKRNRTVEYGTVSSVEFNDHLRKFYGEIKGKHGKLYTPSALTGIRAAIQRHVSSPPFNRPINIIADKEFVSCNKMFVVKCKLYVSTGNQKPKHKDVICSSDMEILGNYFSNFTEDPVVLQHFVWFSLFYYFGKRGREGWRDLQTDTYIVKNENGDVFVSEAKTQSSKNLPGGHKQKDLDYSENRMYDDEAIKAFELFLSKRNPSISAFFQTPLKNYTKADNPWFKQEALGKNRLANIMKEISSIAGLSKVYTSHCVRATCITKLYQAGVPVKQICALTKHKNESSLNHYISGMSSEQKKECGKILESALTGHSKKVPIWENSANTLDVNDSVTVEINQPDGHVETSIENMFDDATDNIISLIPVDDTVTLDVPAPGQSQTYSIAASTSQTSLTSGMFHNSSFNNCSFSINFVTPNN